MKIKTCRCKKPSHFFHIDETGENGGPIIYIVGEEYQYEFFSDQYFSPFGNERGDLYRVTNGKFHMNFGSNPKIVGEGRTFFDFFDIIS